MNELNDFDKFVLYEYGGNFVDIFARFNNGKELEVSLGSINREDIESILRAEDIGFMITEDMTLEYIYKNCFTHSNNPDKYIKRDIGKVKKYLKQNNSYKEIWEKLKARDCSMIKVIKNNGKYYINSYWKDEEEFRTNKEKEIFITKLIEKGNKEKL